MGNNRLCAIIALVCIVLTASLVVSGVTADQASAYSYKQHRVISFVTQNRDSVVRAADLAAAAARADGDGRWVRASELGLRSSRILTRVVNRWMRMPAAGGAVTGLERQFSAFLKNVNIYGLCVYRSMAGDSSWSNVARGNRAWDRAVQNLCNVELELAWLN